MKTLRVVVAHSRYRERGGEDAVVEAEIALLRAHGHEVRELRRDNHAMEQLAAHHQLQQTVWSAAAVKELNDVIRDWRPNVIHVHNTFPALSPAIYWPAAAAAVPVVQTLHNFRLLCVQAMFLRNEKICESCLGRLPWRGAVRRCYRGSLAQSTALAGMLSFHRVVGTFRSKVTRYVALSEFSRHKLIAGGLPAEKITVKPNFVTPPSLAEGERHGALFVGRLSPEKGLHVLVDALAQLPESVCEVIGTGPLVNALGGCRQLHLRGPQNSDRVLESMRKAAYLILPSICYEQFPRTLVEAFGSGLPVIASKLGPLAELIQHGRTGLLFEPGSANALAEQIRFAEQNPHVMRRLGANARAEYEAKYTPERNHEQLMEIYSAAMHCVSN